MTRLKPMLLAATLLTGGLAAGGIAWAQGATTYDPAQLPAIKGTVAQYSLTPRGDVDGLILQDGTEVHLPPHLSTQLVFAVKPGDTVTVHGLKARTLPLVQAMSVTDDASGRTVVDNGPPEGPGHGHGPHGHKGPPEGATLTAQGVVKMQLHGPRGELNGVLLQDGTMIHLPPPEATRLASQLAVGQTVYASGFGSDSAVGRVIGAQAIGPSAAQATAIAAPPHHGPRPPHGPEDAPPAP